MIEEKNDNSTTIMIPSLYHPFKPAFDGTKKDKKNNNDCSDATPELCLPSIASDTIHHGLFSNDKKKNDGTYSDSIDDTYFLWHTISCGSNCKPKLSLKPFLHNQQDVTMHWITFT